MKQQCSKKNVLEIYVDVSLKNGNTHVILQSFASNLNSYTFFTFFWKVRIIAVHASSALNFFS